MFGSRYRIVARLGKGGMGEVYRADDLTLGQTVALKLLPKQLAANEERRARLLSEVRIARQIAHPNVCRVYDVGELEGEHFITMEYVHGEDLAALLHRIGRLPKDKGIEIARQICAGLAAAHERGVLHRDLKPANIMLDERGKVRITDFGLAAAADDLKANAGEGTPAYMAPEQLAGREVTVRSDIYALGLVLYEIFTGRRAFNAGTLAELREMREQRSLTDPSRVVDDIDPAVERVILRCLENDPRDRPPSVLSIAAALPGGDPLAAALAAGETPSPELLAAAGDSVGLRPAVAVPLLLFVLIGLVVGIMLRSQRNLTSYVSLELPPDALALKARETIRQLGYPQKAADTARGFYSDEDLLRYIRDHDRSPRRWERLRSGQPPALLFWYRESNHPLEFQGFFQLGVTRFDPPPTESGMKQISLDPSGRVVFFSAVPEQIESQAAASTPIDWRMPFSAAALDITEFKPVASKWLPPTFADTRAAWEGKYSTGEPLRVEAAAWHGKQVYFHLIGPWTRPAQMTPLQRTIGEKISGGIGIGILVSVLLGGVFLARRNLSLGRGDRRGASRLATTSFVLMLISFALSTTYVSSVWEVAVVIMRISVALLAAATIMMLYLALEPYIRRRWPHALIASGKVLAGRFRDPLVGRDVLIGSAAGVAVNVIAAGLRVITRLLGGTGSAPDDSGLGLLDGMRYAIAMIPDTANGAMFIAFVTVFLLFALRIILRKDSIAASAVLSLVATVAALGSDVPVIAAVVNVLAGGMVLFVMTRFGLVATYALVYTSGLLNSGVTDFTSWHSYTVWIPLSVIAVLSVGAFYFSLAGRPLLREALFET
jgi:serine/threonine-protein kinase